jgi:hypothetical protein
MTHAMAWHCLARPNRRVTPDHASIGTPAGLDAWSAWLDAMNRPSACRDVSRHWPWPPYPGFDVAFGATWPCPMKTYALDSSELQRAAYRADRFEQTYAVADLYLAPIDWQVTRLNGKPALAVCIVSDAVYQNCRPNSYVAEPSYQVRHSSDAAFMNLSQLAGSQQV